MQKLKGGKIARIKHRLNQSIPNENILENDTDDEIDYEVEESFDGSRPSIKIRIKKVCRRCRNHFNVKGWSSFWERVRRK